MDKVEEVLTRGVDNIYPSKTELEKVLKSGKKIKLYQGFDPTGTQMHIGHMVGLRKLRQFQDLGHRVIFLIGDGTGQAGDPSGKTTARKNTRSLILSTHEDKPGVLRKLAETFEKEGISIEEISSQRVKGDINFKIILDEKKYKPEHVTKVVSSLSSQGFFTNEELRLNANTYLQQASKIVRFDGENPIEIMYNGDWLNKLSYEDILNIAGHFSLQQLYERDLFQQRIKDRKEVNLREFLYPVFQAYDSVVLNVDLEVGGSDQTFNMLCGRTLSKQILGKEKFVLTTPLLADSEGRKIGKTEGNVIAITDKPIDLYGKIMNLSDDVIVKALEYLTDITMTEIEKIEKAVKEGQNPLQFKKRLAYEIVSQLNNQKEADNAQQEFESVIQQKKAPEFIEQFTIKSGATQSQILIESGLTNSMSEAKRMIQQGSVSVSADPNNIPFTKITDPRGVPTQNEVIKIGSRDYRNIILIDKGK